MNTNFNLSQKLDALHLRQQRTPYSVHSGDPMYLARLEIENYRVFGSQASGKHLVLELHSGLNLLLGENDSGKTCVVDAIRLVLGTLPPEHFAPVVDDFHCENGVRAKALSIKAYLTDLSDSEAAAFLEFLTVESRDSKAEYSLTLTLRAEIDESQTRTSRRSPVRYEWRAGVDAEGQRFEGPARELLRATYLRPLRDAVGELTAKKGSRLAQILHSYPELSGQEVSDWDPSDANCQPKTLTGAMRRAEHAIRESDVVKNAEAKLNEDYLKPFSIGPRPLSGKIGISQYELRQILERLELTLADHEQGATRGLGLHNVLFMAAELLALERDNDPCLPLVLIEEPEAHLHPQLQLRLVEFFRRETEPQDGHTRLQIILTSHSPNIASKVGLKHVTLMHAGQAFSLRAPTTKLDPSDYEFLERFLDVTRADLFFARGLLIVEGDAESILLPTLAELIGCALTEHGVSVINVGSIGLFRYARIFQRSDNIELPIRVACVADRDIPPDEAKTLVGQDWKTEGEFGPGEVDALAVSLKSEDAGAVKTFVSDHWTFEYDLARSGLIREVHAAVTLAVSSKNRKRALKPEEQRSCLRTAFREHRKWIAEGKTSTEMAVLAYTPLVKKRASKPETAQYLACLLRRACKSSGFDLHSRLPAYVLGAIKYSVRNDGVAMIPAAPTQGAPVATP